MFGVGLRSSCAQFEQVSTSIRRNFFLYTKLQTQKCPGDFVTDLTKTSKWDDSGQYCSMVYYVPLTLQQKCEQYEQRFCQRFLLEKSLQFFVQCVRAFIQYVCQSLCWHPRLYDELVCVNRATPCSQYTHSPHNYHYTVVLLTCFHHSPCYCMWHMDYSSDTCSDARKPRSPVNTLTTATQHRYLTPIASNKTAQAPRGPVLPDLTLKLPHVIYNKREVQIDVYLNVNI